MSIEDKLRDKLSDSAIILEANRDVGPSKYEIALNLFLDDAISQIIQAFKDEGWYPPEKIMHAKDYGDLMKKQQFYERFVKEFDDIREPGDDEILDSNSASQVLEAARKAAGLE